jgi:hypothetical protein
MSLLLAYHDPKKAIVCSDDRATTLDKQALDYRVPKFIMLDEFLILGSVGRRDTIEKLQEGTEMILLASDSEVRWAQRQISPNIPPSSLLHKCLTEC